MAKSLGADAMQVRIPRAGSGAARMAWLGAAPPAGRDAIAYLARSSLVRVPEASSYDVNGGSQTWNAAAANAFAGAPHTLAAPSLGAMAPIGSQTGRLRSSRPRVGLPGVSCTPSLILLSM